MISRCNAILFTFLSALYSDLTSYRQLRCHIAHSIVKLLPLSLVLVCLHYLQLISIFTLQHNQGTTPSIMSKALPASPISSTMSSIVSYVTMYQLIDYLLISQ